MTSSVERLQSLLERVQKNRRSAAPRASRDSETTKMPVVGVRPRSAPPARPGGPVEPEETGPVLIVEEPTGPELELLEDLATEGAGSARPEAFTEDRASAPVLVVEELPSDPALDELMAATSSAPPSRAEPAALAVPPAPPVPAMPDVLAPTPIARPADAIARTVGERAPSRPKTLRELVLRSLALRPR